MMTITWDGPAEPGQYITRDANILIFRNIGKRFAGYCLETSDNTGSWSSCNEWAPGDIYIGGGIWRHQQKSGFGQQGKSGGG